MFNIQRRIDTYFNVLMETGTLESFVSKDYVEDDTLHVLLKDGRKISKRLKNPTNNVEITGNVSDMVPFTTRSSSE